MVMNPLQLAFYKGVGGKHGALQFNLQRPHYYLKSNPKLKNYDGKFIPKRWLEGDMPVPLEDDLTSREGALFMEVTSATGRNVYDWERKIVMALSINDMGKLLTVLEGLQQEVSIMHDPGAKTAAAGKVKKWLNVDSPDGLKTGVMVRVRMTAADNETTSHTVPLSGDEVKVLAACIRAVIPAALAWV
jgi:hypothetical protein